MKPSKKLGLLLIILIFTGLTGFSIDAVRQAHFGEKFLQIFNLSCSGRETLRVVSEESAVVEMVEKASPAVVSVLQKQVIFDLFRGPRLEESSIGTGFFADSDIIVTNRHVVAEKDAEYTVVTNESQKFSVVEIYRDSLNDLALIKVSIEDNKVPILELGDSDSIKVGQTVVAIGNALGRFDNTVTRGVISGIGRGITATSGLGQYQRLEDVIQTDAALNPGNSGGPLLNLGGQVIGVNVAVGEGTENIGFAIPVNKVKELVENFLQNRKISRPLLGVTYLVITSEMAAERDLPEGAYVQEVVEGSAAEKGGIKPGDIITHVGDVKIDKIKTLAKLILEHKVGEKIKVKIWRAGKELTVETVLEEAEEE